MVNSVRDYLLKQPDITFRISMNSRPRDSDDCITIVANGGANPELHFGKGHLSIRRPMVNIFIRSKSADKATQQGEAIQKCMPFYSDSSLGVDGAIPLNDLAGMGHDDKQRSEFLLVYSILVKE